MNSKNQEHQIECKNQSKLTLYPLISPYYLTKVHLPHLQFNFLVGYFTQKSINYYTKNSHYPFIMEVFPV